VTLRPFFSPEYSIRLRSVSRASQIEQEFGRYLTGFARFKAFAVTDQDPITGSREFGLTTFGGEAGEFPDEIEAWVSSVLDNPDWRTLQFDFLD
jgi:hypothetical protein